MLPTERETRVIQDYFHGFYLLPKVRHLQLLILEWKETFTFFYYSTIIWEIWDFKGYESLSQITS